MKRIYLTAGASLIPQQHNITVKALEDLGYEVVSSKAFHDSCQNLTNWKALFTALLSCDAVISMQHWFESDIAKKEVEVARIAEIPVHHFSIVNSLAPCSQS